MTKKLLQMRYLIVFSAVIISAFISYQAITNTGGPNGGLTNAPSEGNCTQCHSGSLITSGSNWDNFSLTSNIPQTGYIPDSSYIFTISHTQSGINKFGFQATVLQLSNNTRAGSISVQNSTTTQYKTANSRDYITHTSSGVSGSGSISWSFNWTAPSTDVGDIRLYSTLNATNNQNNSSGDQIYARHWTFSISSLLPTAVITPSTSSPCVGDTLFLSGSGANNPTGWQWTMTGGTPSSASTQNTFVVYTTSGTKQITLVTTNDKGKSKPASINVNVVAKPSATITISGNTNLCPGDSVILSAPSGSGLSYLWNTAESTRSITVKDSGEFFVVVRNTSGCTQQSQTITTTLATAPSVSLSSSALNDSICKREMLVLTATAGLSNYDFYNASTLLQSDTSSTYQTDALSNGNDLYVIVTNAEGCKASSNHLSITVVEPATGPVLNCGTKTTSSVEFIWQSLPDAEEYLVSTDSGQTWVSPSGGALGLSHEISGLDYSQNVCLMIKAKDNSICGFTDISKHFCTSLSCSGIEFDCTYDTNLCMGDSLHVYVKNISVPNFSISFNNAPFSKDSFFTILPDSSQTYTLQIIDSNELNCPVIIIYLPVEVEMPKSLSLTSDPKNFSLCPGSMMNIYGPSDYTKYTWFVNHIPLGTTPSFSYSSFFDKDSVFLMAESALGCKNYSDTIAVTVYETKKPYLKTNSLKNSFCDRDDIMLIATPDFELYTFKDHEGNVKEYGVDSTTFLTLSPGSYRYFVVVSDGNACQTQSDTVSLSVNPLPLAGFTYMANELEFTFNDTTANAVSWLWDFGDMQSSILKNPVHLFAMEGQYNIVLFATDQNDCVDSVSQLINAEHSNLITDSRTDFRTFYLPSSAELYVLFNMHTEDEVNIVLISVATGQIIEEKSMKLSGGNHRLILPVSGLNKGVYVLQMLSEGKVNRQKVLIY